MLKNLHIDGMGKVSGGDIKVLYVGPSGDPFLDMDMNFWVLVDTDTYADTGDWIDIDGSHYPPGTNTLRFPIEEAELRLNEVCIAKG